MHSKGQQQTEELPRLCFGEIITLPTIIRIVRIVRIVYIAHVASKDPSLPFSGRFIRVICRACKSYIQTFSLSHHLALMSLK